MLRSGCVRSVGGTAGYRPAAAADPEACPVVLMPHADRAGAGPVSAWRADLPGRGGRTCYTHLHELFGHKHQAEVPLPI